MKALLILILASSAMADSYVLREKYPHALAPIQNVKINWLPAESRKACGQYIFMEGDDQVWFNLISAGIMHSPKNKVKIKATKDDKKITVSYSKTGWGIATIRLPKTEVRQTKACISGK